MSTSSREVRQLEVVEDEAERVRVRPEPGGAARAVERLEHLGERKPERVRGAVRRGHERQGAGARRDRERSEVGRAHPRQIGIDDEADAVDSGERSLTRRRPDRLPGSVTTSTPRLPGN